MTFTRAAVAGMLLCVAACRSPERNAATRALEPVAKLPPGPPQPEPGFGGSVTTIVRPGERGLPSAATWPADPVSRPAGAGGDRVQVSLPVR